MKGVVISEMICKKEGSADDSFISSIFTVSNEKLSEHGVKICFKISLFAG